jgi:EpsI family protein
MLDRRTILVPLFMVAQTIVVHWVVGPERAPEPSALRNFPAAFDEWRFLRQDPIDEGVAVELRADQLLSWSYMDISRGQLANLFVAWFRSQREGTGQPHSPKVCLPAAGWTPAMTGEVTLGGAAGAIAVNRYVVVNRGQRIVVLYWYQGPRRVTAGEWESKLWLVADALRYRRTDTALVRVVVQAATGGDQEATAIAIRFAQSVYPLLRETLPR